FQNLPYIVGTNESISTLYTHYNQTLSLLLTSSPSKFDSLDSLITFTNLLKQINKSTSELDIPTLFSNGVDETRVSKCWDLEHMNLFAGVMYRGEIGRRMVSEHFVEIVEGFLKKTTVVGKEGVVGIVDTRTRAGDLEAVKGAEEWFLENQSGGVSVPNVVIDGNLFPRLNLNLNLNKTPKISESPSVDLWCFGKGNGLGLPMTKVYARYWGGDVGLCSMRGFGTDAYFSVHVGGELVENLRG
ncbi:hypothetical protein HDU76_007784, partial [Blyttiomyces sp. JEL0837]